MESELRPFLRLMRLCGFWPYGPEEAAAATAAHWLYVRCTMLCLLVFSAQQLIQMTEHPDLNNISSSVDVATVTISALYRQVLFTFFVEDFERIVDKVDANFEPQRLMPRRARFDMRNWMRRSKIYTYVYLSLPILGTAVWVASKNVGDIETDEALEKGSAAATSLELGDESVLNVTSTDAGREARLEKMYVKRQGVLVNCWYPFDSGVSPASEITFVWETTVVLYSGMAYVISDLFLFTVIHLICGQLEITRSSFLLLHEDFEDHKPKAKHFGAFAERREVRMERDITRCVDYHCAVIGLIGDLDRSVRTLIVVDFLHAVISISFAMLQMTTADAAYEWLQMMIFIGVSVLHQLLNNLFAEALGRGQESVAEAAYGAAWPGAPPALCAAVRLATARARRPVLLSGWKMYVLGNATFVEFMRLLLSYFLVLQSLHAKERGGQS